MRLPLCLLVVLAALCLAVAPASAAAPKDDHAPAAHGEGAKDGAKPAAKESINIFEPRFDLGVWTVVVFLGLFFILKKYAWGPMIEGLAKREERIKGALEEAKKARDEARKIQAELQKERDANAQKIATMMDEARRDAEQLKTELKAQGTKDIQAERERLSREMNTRFDQALQELWQRTADLAVRISAKTVRKQLNADDHRALIDEALNELKTTGEAHRRVSVL